MPIKRQTNDAIRKSRHEMGFEAVREDYAHLSREDLIGKATGAQEMVNRNYAAGKRLSAAYYEGKVAGCQSLLRERGEANGGRA